jgi:hypothetical protein
MALYKTDICMKLFNIASPMLASKVGQHAIDRGCASEPDDSRLYKKKTMTTMITFEIYLVYPSEPSQCT